MMSWTPPLSRPPPAPADGWYRKRGYHHGNLRASALPRGRQLVTIHGPAALTLRGLARDLGVTATSLVREFGNLAGLRRRQHQLYRLLSGEGWHAPGPGQRGIHGLALARIDGVAALAPRDQALNAPRWVTRRTGTLDVSRTWSCARSRRMSTFSRSTSA